MKEEWSRKKKPDLWIATPSTDANDRNRWSKTRNVWVGSGCFWRMKNRVEWPNRHRCRVHMLIVLMLTFRRRSFCSSSFYFPFEKNWLFFRRCSKIVSRLFPNWRSLRQWWSNWWWIGMLHAQHLHTTIPFNPIYSSYGNHHTTIPATKLYF